MRILILSFLCLLNFFSAQAQENKPNILLVLLDDVGMTDFGSFGSEIATPNIDKLAYDGTRLVNFYTAPTCSPTRSMLLTGVDNHLVGLGNMHEDLAPNQKGQPGYEGYLNDKAITLAEALSTNGYHTAMAGKWHLGLNKEHGPANRGFKQSFALLQGGGGHFDDLGLYKSKSFYRENGELVSLPKDFYSTQFFTEKITEYIEQSQNDNKPFFAYLAYTATHWPLQAPESSIKKYRGSYQQGYDKLYQTRVLGAEKAGVLPNNYSYVPKLKSESNWQELSEQQKQFEQRKMEIYAAMLDDVDVYLGKLINYLKSKELFDNTIILIMSDNGTEGHNLNHGLTEFGEWIDECCDNSFDNMGKADSYLFLGPNWARASVGPFSLFKGFASEGGIRSPAIYHYPKRPMPQKLSRDFVHVKDIFPTLLELTNTSLPPSNHLGRKTPKVTGQSIFRKDSKVIDVGWELMGKQAYRYQQYKIVLDPKPYGTGNWQLFDLEQDPSEQFDLAKSKPKVLKQLLGKWQLYAEQNNVITPNWLSGY